MSKQHSVKSMQLGQAKLKARSAATAKNTMKKKRSTLSLSKGKNTSRMIGKGKPGRSTGGAVNPSVSARPVQSNKQRSVKSMQANQARLKKRGS